jgi:antitoxin YefM
MAQAPPVRSTGWKLQRPLANAAHLQRSLEQAGRGELLSHGLIDPDLADAGD